MVLTDEDKGCQKNGLQRDQQCQNSGRKLVKFPGVRDGRQSIPTQPQAEPGHMQVHKGHGAHVAANGMRQTIRRASFGVGRSFELRDDFDVLARQLWQRLSGFPRSDDRTRRYRLPVTIRGWEGVR